MRKYVIAIVIMVLGVSLGIYSVFQRDYYEDQMWYWEQKTRDAQGIRDYVLASNYSAKGNESYKNGLLWGSLGVVGGGVAVAFLIITLRWLAKGDGRDIETIYQRQKAREKQKEKEQIAEKGKEKDHTGPPA
jgi:hypothetical protein